mgnify:CR=1 FL=1
MEINEGKQRANIPATYMDAGELITKIRKNKAGVLVVIGKDEHEDLYKEKVQMGPSSKPGKS